MTSEEKLILEARQEALDHAWSWFTLHAGQRMQLVNYYLISIAFILAAYATSLQSNRPNLSGCIALAGLGVSIAFALVEERTRELIKAAEIPLLELEEALGKRAQISSLELVLRVEKPRIRWTSYSTAIRSLQVLGAGGFIAASIYGFTTSSQTVGDSRSGHSGSASTPRPALSNIHGPDWSADVGP